MKLKDLLEKDVTVEYIDSETSDIVGELVEIDTDANIIHVHTYYNQTDHLIPLFSVKSIREKY